MGIDDIKAVAFECTACSSRICIQPDREIEIPGQCPQCRREWMLLNPGPRQIITGSPFAALSNGIKRIRSLAEEGIDPGFRVLFEFEEPH